MILGTIVTYVFCINIDIKVNLLFAVLGMPYKLIWANISIICFWPVIDIITNKALSSTC